MSTRAAPARRLPSAVALVVQQRGSASKAGNRKFRVLVILIYSICFLRTAAHTQCTTFDDGVLRAAIHAAPRALRGLRRLLSFASVFDPGVHQNDNQISAYALKRHGNRLPRDNGGHCPGGCRERTSFAWPGFSHFLSIRFRFFACRGSGAALSLAPHDADLARRSGRSPAQSPVMRSDGLMIEAR